MADQSGNRMIKHRQNDSCVSHKLDRYYIMLYRRYIRFSIRTRTISRGGEVSNDEDDINVNDDDCLQSPQSPSYTVRQA